ncbi:hypothetical protein LTR53_009799 [Teratosphaeriaceae sp. CCFEE 6253]|nr:hypothetical protein LTR53_009799 [Teratosphaeriaceae sp. CCFEE 6253]
MPNPTCTDPTPRASSPGLDVAAAAALLGLVAAALPEAAALEPAPTADSLADDTALVAAVDEPDAGALVVAVPLLLPEDSVEDPLAAVEVPRGVLAAPGAQVAADGSASAKVMVAAAKRASVLHRLELGSRVCRGARRTVLIRRIAVVPDAAGQVRQQSSIRADALDGQLRAAPEGGDAFTRAGGEAWDADRVDGARERHDKGEEGG